MKKNNGFIELFILPVLVFIGVLLLWPVEGDKQRPLENNSPITISSDGCQLNTGPQKIIDGFAYGTDATQMSGEKLYGEKLKMDFKTHAQYKLLITNVALLAEYVERSYFLYLFAKKEPNAKDLAKDEIFEKGDIKIIDGKKFLLLYPRPHGVIHSEIPSLRRQQLRINPSELKFAYLIHLNDDYSPITPDVTPGALSKKNSTYIVVDVYQDVRGPSISQDKMDAMLAECQRPTDGAPSSQITPQSNEPDIIFPEQDRSEDRKELQLEYFEFGYNPQQGAVRGAWTIHCKPAIYLYPERPTYMNVKVLTKGSLTYTDPLYPKNGWNTYAYPDGKLVVDGKIFPYLYYESKIPDLLIHKPKQGFVVPFSQLPQLFSSLLPKLGLNTQQTQDFKDYWEKTLPAASYYFVGVMDQGNIDAFEPLVIKPQPKTNIRVRLYFEALDKNILIEEPVIQTPQRNGFTMVEWGGMIKMDKAHPFTCSQ